MTKTANPVVIGIIAGLVAAILMVGAVYSLALVFLAPILSLTVIFAVALGFGNVAGIAAVLTGFVVIGLFSSSVTAGISLALPLLPALAMSYAANLARPASEIGGPDGSVAWYPLSDILLIGAACSGLLMSVIFVIVLADFNMAENIERAVPLMEQIQPGLVITPEMKSELAVVMKAIAPPMYAAMYLLILFAGFYVAMRILTALKLNTRPREDIRSSLRMNRLAILILLLGIALAFTVPPLSVIGSAFAGAVAAGFMLAGYALIHEIVRNKRWALFALLALYFVTFFMLPVLAFIICVAGGLANPRRAVAITPARPTETPET